MIGVKDALSQLVDIKIALVRTRTVDSFRQQVAIPVDTEVQGHGIGRLRIPVVGHPVNIYRRVGVGLHIAKRNDARCCRSTDTARILVGEIASHGTSVVAAAGCAGIDLAGGGIAEVVARTVLITGKGFKTAAERVQIARV